MKKAIAHGVHEDAGISALLHIDPNDHPIVGQEAKFYFTFQDSTGLFDIKKCDCIVTVLKDETEIDKQPIQIDDMSFAALGSNPLYSKTFDEAGEYELELSGAPRDGGAFQPFQLQYDFHTQEASASGAVHGSDHHSFAGEHLGHIIIFGSGLIAAIILLVRNYYKNRPQKN